MASIISDAVSAAASAGQDSLITSLHGGEASHHHEAVAGVTAPILSDYYAHLLIVVPAVLGLLWAIYESIVLSKITLKGHYNNSSASDKQSSLLRNDAAASQMESGQNVARTVAIMKEISGYIAEGATAFLLEEYKYLLVFVIVFGAIIGPGINYPTCIAFVAGCLTSILCGYIGMKTAVYANVRTAHESWKDLASGYDVAIRGGSVMGMCLVSLGVIILYFLVIGFQQFISNPAELFECLAGYGLGGSSIALFGRVGGGIYTKAADVGADLSGKNEYGMDEDDPRNPACIADNVGDNVGDVAGMGADLFGSFAESTCAALVISSAAPGALSLHNYFPSMMFPVLLSSTGIVVGILTMLCVSVIYKVRDLPDVEKALKGVLIISTILQTPCVVYLAYYCLPSKFSIDPEHQDVTPNDAIISVLLGLWSGLIIGFVTEYYTSHSYRPVREISNTQIVSAATGIIYGLALGYLSCIIPIMCLIVTVCVGHSIAGMYGVSLGAIGMLGTLTMGLTIDAYGPISDNAGGIAEMSELGPDVRRRTDALDAAGNTTAAIGKGFAIGSAALVSLALFGAYCVRAKVHVVDILDPWTFTGLLYGAMMPYAFSAMTMKSVGTAANDMVNECMAQFPKIISGEMRPQYNKCIAISTDASLRAMMAPGALVILSPILAGLIFGKNCTAGLLSGALVSGVQMAISMSNTGGAWDNAKKYIESGGLGSNHGKGSAAHKNAVTGDTVGDPLKDTSGPSLNILVKLSAIISLVFGGVIDSFSNSSGGPFWL